MLATVVAAGAVAWTLVWRGAAGRLRQETETLLIVRGGAQCENLATGGFPFRIGIFCDRIAANGQAGATLGDWRIASGAMRSAAQFYNPGHVIAEFDAPLEFESSRLPALRGEWTTARASLRAGFTGLKRLSVELRDPALLLFGSRRIAAAASMQGHARPARNPVDGDLAFAIDDAQIAPGVEVPAFDLAGDLTIRDFASYFAGQGDVPERIRERLQERGIAGEVRGLEFAPASGGRLHLAGSFAVGADGVTNARLKVDVEDAAAIAAFFVPLVKNVEARNTAERIAAALALLPAGATGIDLVVENGQLRLGAFSLGRVPRLF
jgi:hypothetical protein